MERRGKGILRIIKLCKENGIICNFSETPDQNEFVMTYMANKISKRRKFDQGIDTSKMMNHLVKFNYGLFQEDLALLILYFYGCPHCYNEVKIDF